VVLAHVGFAYELAAKSADLVFVTPHDPDEAASIIAEVRAAESAVGRTGPPLQVYADLVVLLERDTPSAEAALTDLDERAGAPLRSDAEIVAGSPSDLADLLVSLHDAGIEGFRLRPGRLPVDLDAIVDGLVPELRARGLFSGTYGPGTFRERLGLERPASRYATSSVTSIEGALT
jgi:alkanesulfonate monooxygenase SsuD/methylene tetrahydromethanopterin reductase-like flavin-dependent oxidoreductase (luciferase family)